MDVPEKEGDDDLVEDAGHLTNSHVAKKLTGMHQLTVMVARIDPKKQRTVEKKMIHNKKATSF